MTCKRAAIVRGQRLCAAGPGSDLKMGSSLPDSNSKILLPLERASCLLLERTLFTALQGDDWLWDGNFISDHFTSIQRVIRPCKSA